jgi:hypothetical protein
MPTVVPPVAASANGEDRDGDDVINSEHPYGAGEPIFCVWETRRPMDVDDFVGFLEGPACPLNARAYHHVVHRVVSAQGQGWAALPEAAFPQRAPARLVGTHVWMPMMDDAMDAMAGFARMMRTLHPHEDDESDATSAHSTSTPVTVEEHAYTYATGDAIEDAIEDAIGTHEQVPYGSWVLKKGTEEEPLSWKVEETYKKGQQTPYGSWSKNHGSSKEAHVDAAAAEWADAKMEQIVKVTPVHMPQSVRKGASADGTTDSGAGAGDERRADDDAFAA